MIETILKENAGFTLLIAPPAWGKTQLLKKLFQDHTQQFLFVSPLRALANEFYQNIKDQFLVINIERGTDWDKLKDSNWQIIIITPELINDCYLNNFEKIKMTIILDEFHLFFYWGTTFREKMWETMFDLFTLDARNKQIIGLTATMSNENINFMQEQFASYDNQITIVNLGNQQLKNFPRKIIFLPRYCSKSWEFFIKKDQNVTLLLFCQYRKQVHQLESAFQKKGYQVLTCLGGEAGEFSHKLKQMPSPDLIISTTVLSHGVNLPPLKRIIFTYPINNLDFWIQMVGRGGRRGEAFEVVSYDDFNLNRWLKLRSFFTIIVEYIKYQLTWNDDF